MIRTARRERERSGRVAGANRGSARAAHADAEYDVEIDTTDGQLAALAQELHSKIPGLSSSRGVWPAPQALAFLSRVRRSYAHCAMHENSRLSSTSSPRSLAASGQLSISSALSSPEKGLSRSTTVCRER